MSTEKHVQTFGRLSERGKRDRACRSSTENRGCSGSIPAAAVCSRDGRTKACDDGAEHSEGSSEGTAHKTRSSRCNRRSGERFDSESGGRRRSCAAGSGLASDAAP